MLVRHLDIQPLLIACHTWRMSPWSLSTLVLASCVILSSSQQKNKQPQTISRGWGKGITWVATYEEGLRKMKENNKPLMVIHHKEDCPHSKSLKKLFAVDKAIQKIAKQDFIMLNLVEETTDSNLAPDGYYVPRILFVDPSMKVRADITSKYSNHLYTYQASDLSVLADNMKKAKLLLHTEL
ncbi:anterior gradient protein 3-like isoform X1 [Osmerus eperlanus]|uniref:anterior gradient protein 3-like isoform X1 n=2 Tax=Osmerus eperlanus TaxID=29151 RepID=UPI002E14372C